MSENEHSSDDSDRLKDTPDCPICGSKTDDVGRYRACEEHGTVLKKVKKVVGYRPLDNNEKPNSDK